MKPSIATALLVLLRTTAALPQADLVKRADPVNVPVTINQLPTTSFTCGPNRYSIDDVNKAITYGVLLSEMDPPQGRGKKSNEYPNGRFPHPFLSNRDAPALAFAANCPDNDNDRAAYPLVNNGPYNGGISNNNKWGDDRVVYVHEKGEIDITGNYQATFCGVMTHSGTGGKVSFSLCTSP